MKCASEGFSPVGRGLRELFFCLALIIIFTGCSSPTLKDDIVKPKYSSAEPPADSGILAELAAGITAEHGEEYSGFRILDSN